MPSQIGHRDLNGWTVNPIILLLKDGFMKKKPIMTGSQNSRLSVSNQDLSSTAIFLPISAGESTTCIPHSRMICFLASAVSSLPPMIAPA